MKNSSETTYRKVLNTEFLKDPNSVVQTLRESGPVSIVDDNGHLLLVISFPAVSEDPLDEFRRT